MMTITAHYGGRVWDYPRPPVVVTYEGVARVELAGEPVAESDHALMVLERSHPPTVYVPAEQVVAELCERPGSTFCEFKGRSFDLDVRVPTRLSTRAAWIYPAPRPAFAALREHVAFYPGRLDCWLDDEPVKPQLGGFYGGWITPGLEGPFKGGPGTATW